MLWFLLSPRNLKIRTFATPLLVSQVLQACRHRSLSILGSWFRWNWMIFGYWNSLVRSCQFQSTTNMKILNPLCLTSQSLISHGKSRTFCRSLVALVQEAWHNCQRHTENPEIHSTTARASIEIDGNTKKKSKNNQHPTSQHPNIQHPTTQQRNARKLNELECCNRVANPSSPLSAPAPVRGKLEAVGW